MTITLSGINNGASVVPLPVLAGGTGSTTSADARTALGLGNLDNTSDANKPVSTAQQTALNLKANLVSPTLVTPVLGVATGTSFNSLTGLSSTTPVVAGTAAIGAATTAARADHVHPLQTSVTGNAATVTTNANLTGHVTSTGNAAVLGSFTLAQLNTAVSDGDVQAALVSGTSIKTVNGSSLLGSGNLVTTAEVPPGAILALYSIGVI
jgi:hypothetical protein